MLKEIEFPAFNGNCDAAFCNNFIDFLSFIENSSEWRLGTASSHPLSSPLFIQMPCQPGAAQKLGGRPARIPPGALKSRQPAYKPGSGWHAGFWPAYVTAIPLGRRLPGASSNLPGRPDLDTIPRPLALARKKPRAVPIRSCSRWGLPCRRRYRRRGALLPHRFTLAAACYATRRGGLFSVALSLGSHPPDVIRHRLSTEPGLSSPATFRFRRSGRPAD